MNNTASRIIRSEEITIDRQSEPYIPILDRRFQK